MLEPTGTHQVMVSNRGAQYFRITVPGTEGGTEYHREIDSAIDNAYMVINIIKNFQIIESQWLIIPFTNMKELLKFRQLLEE